MSPDEAYRAMLADLDAGAEFPDAVDRWANQVTTVSHTEAVDYLETRYDADSRPSSFQQEQR